MIVCKTVEKEIFPFQDGLKYGGISITTSQPRMMNAGVHIVRPKNLAVQNAYHNIIEVLETAQPYLQKFSSYV